MKVATVWESSVPRSMILRHKGMISVCNRKLITLWSSIFTRAPITPKEVNLRYSKGLPLLTVFKNGYKNSGMCAFRKSCLVSLWDATLWSSAKTLQALLDVLVSKFGGESEGYTATISYKRAVTVPTECQINGANSEKCSRHLLNSIKALSLLSAYLSSSMYLTMDIFWSSVNWVLLMKFPWLLIGYKIYYAYRWGSLVSWRSSDCLCDIEGVGREFATAAPPAPLPFDFRFCIINQLFI